MTASRAARASAVPDATASRCPRPPQPQIGPSSSTGTWPSSPAIPSGPWNSRPSVTIAATDPGRHRHVDEVVLTAAGPVGRLAERGDVRVPVEERRQAERRLHVIGQRHVAEARTEVRRLDDRARARVDRAGARDADAHDRLADLGRRAVARGDEGGRTRVDDRGRGRARWASRSRRGSGVSRQAGRRRPGSGFRPGRAQGPVVTTGRNLEIAVWDRGHSSKGPVRPRGPTLPRSRAGWPAAASADSQRPPPRTARVVERLGV